MPLNRLNHYYEQFTMTSHHINYYYATNLNHWLKVLLIDWSYIVEQVSRITFTINIERKFRSVIHFAIAESVIKNGVAATGVWQRYATVSNCVLLKVNWKFQNQSIFLSWRGDNRFLVVIIMSAFEFRKENVFVIW